MEHRKKNFVAVDIFKFICAILVIAIHAKPFENNFWLDAGVGLATRFAVPYFFVASGFFLFKSVYGRNDATAKLKKYELRMIRFYAVWFAIHTLYSILRGYIYSPGYYLRHFLLPNNGSILWFLPATMLAVFIVHVLSCVMNTKKVLTLSIVVWLLGYGMSTLAPLFASNAAISGAISFMQSSIGIQNGIFFGFPYIALSKVLAEEKSEKRMKRDIMGILLSFLCLGAESILVVTRLSPPLTFLWLSALPLTYFTFHLTMTVTLKERPVFIAMRKISTLVYVIHPIIIPVLSSMLEIVRLADPQNLMLFFMTCLVSIGLSWLLYILSEKPGWKALRYLM